MPIPFMIRSCVAVAALAILAQPIHAQDTEAEPVQRNARQGVWAGLGLGPGSLGIHCAACATTRISGPTGYVRIGGTVQQRFRLGAELSAWSKTAGGVKQTLLNGTMNLFWFPNEFGPWYLRFGLGGTYFKLDDSSGSTRDSAPVLSVGTGIEFRITRNLALAPFATLYRSNDVVRRVNGVALPNQTPLSYDMLQAGVAITLH